MGKTLLSELSKPSSYSFLLFLFLLPSLVQDANAAERTFYVTEVVGSQCMSGSQYDPLNQYSQDNSDLIILKGTGLGSTEDGLAGGQTCWSGRYIGQLFVNPIANKYSSIGCFIDSANKKAGIVSWSDSEIRLYAPQSISDEIYLNNVIPLRILDTQLSGGNDCKSVRLSLTQTCSNFTYSDWGTCSQNGTQDRSVVSSSPTACTGGEPTVSQSCTPACTLEDYSCGDWSACSSSGSQTRTCSKVGSCEGGVQIPDTTQSCTYTTPTCTSWTYSEWGSCSAEGQQARTVSSSSPGGCTGGSPVLTQSCTPATTCIEDTYACGEWVACSADGVQTRTCNLTYNCTLVGSEPPEETQSCTYNGPLISSLTPVAIYPGTSVTLNGSKFMNLGQYSYSCFNCKVLVNNKVVSGLYSWNWFENKVVFTMPNDSQSGYIQVQDSTGKLSNKFNFSVSLNPATILPIVTGVSPQTITPGDTITITGSNFGSSRGSSKLVNGSGSSLSGAILSWTDSQITYVTSTYYDTSSKKIGVQKCESYASCADPVYGSYIYVQHSISSLSTYTGAVGDTVRIYGKYLKSSNLTSDSDEYYYISAYFNGTGADIINWENTYIDVSVPDGATDGVISIKLTADGVSTVLTASSPSFDVLEMLSDDPLSAYQDYFKQISIPQAWGLVQDRREIIVAVIDDGVYNNHPEFSDKLWQNTDEVIGNDIDDDKNGYIDDRYGWDFAYDTPEMSPTGSHGTQVAGIIGASTNNGVGIAGVNWNVEIMPLIIFDSNGDSSGSINEAIYYAVDNGAEVINLSLGTSGTSGYSPGYDIGIKYAYDHNVLVVASAGNGDPLGGFGYNLNSIPQSPVCNDGDENRVIGVGAVDSHNIITKWSNYGTNCVDIKAPGEDIYTTTIPTSSSTFALYRYATGTSFSAPIVTGIVSLLKAACPTITSQEAINLLISNADGGVVNAYKTLKDEFACLHQETSSNSSTSSTSSSDSSSSSQSDGLTSSTFQSRDSVLSREISLLSSVDTSLTTRLIGKILLQVESRGEAWYVNPVDSKKYYMGRPWDAFQLMRGLGLGITDADLALIPTNEDEWEGDDELIERLSGRILLQVESRGQAWYINPDDGKRYYMGLPSDAFSLMRSLGLGITDADLRKIDVEVI